MAGLSILLGLGTVLGLGILLGLGTVLGLGILLSEASGPPARASTTSLGLSSCPAERAPDLYVHRSAAALEPA